MWPPFLSMPVHTSRGLMLAVGSVSLLMFIIQVSLMILHHQDDMRRPVSQYRWVKPNPTQLSRAHMYSN
ncbi:hypothetical protein Mapa_003413 [Marchantia paleacea]|nr:hypothetical protein Mapa_003413 [Marchantia paleacea]